MGQGKQRKARRRQDLQAAASVKLDEWSAAVGRGAAARPSDDLPAEAMQALRDRRALLWVAQRYDLVLRESHLAGRDRHLPRSCRQASDSVLLDEVVVLDLEEDRIPGNLDVRLGFECDRLPCRERLGP